MEICFQKISTKFNFFPKINYNFSLLSFSASFGKNSKFLRIGLEWLQTKDVFSTVYTIDNLA